MFRLWAKKFKNTKLISDIVIENNDDKISRTKKVFSAIEKVCQEFDLSTPLWLDSTVNDFKRYDKARFYQDNFIESIDFDFLEIHVIEE